jgi:hypothetical protein
MRACHQHETNRGVRERDLRLADGERRLEIERHRLPRRDRTTTTGRGPLAVVDEDELTVALVHEPRVVRRHPGHRQDDVAIRSAAYEDGLFAEARYHAGRSESGVRAP